MALIIEYSLIIDDSLSNYWIVYSNHNELMHEYNMLMGCLTG